MHTLNLRNRPVSEMVVERPLSDNGSNDNGSIISASGPWDTDKRRNDHLARIKAVYGFSLHDLVHPWNKSDQPISLHSVSAIEAILKLLTTQEYSRARIIREFHNLQPTNEDRPPPRSLFQKFKTQLERKFRVAPYSSSSSALSSSNSIQDGRPSRTGAPELRDRAEATISHHLETTNPAITSTPRLQPSCPESTGLLSPGTSRDSSSKIHQFETNQDEHGSTGPDYTDHGAHNDTHEASRRTHTPIPTCSANDSQAMLDTLPTPSSTTSDPPNSMQPIATAVTDNNQAPNATASVQGPGSAHHTVSIPTSSQGPSPHSAEPHTPAILYQTAAVRTWQARVRRSEIKLDRSTNALRAAKQKFFSMTGQALQLSAEEHSPGRGPQEGEPSEMLQAKEEAAMQREGEAFDVYFKARAERLRQWKLVSRRRKQCESFQKGLAALQNLMHEGCLASHRGDEFSDEDDWDGQGDEEEVVEGEEGLEDQPQGRVDSGETGAAKALIGFAAAGRTGGCRLPPKNDRRWTTTASRT